jgi:hypothetical protein
VDSRSLASSLYCLSRLSFSPIFSAITHSLTHAIGFFTIWLCRAIFQLNYMPRVLAFSFIDHYFVASKQFFYFSKWVTVETETDNEMQSTTWYVPTFLFIVLERICTTWWLGCVLGIIEQIRLVGCFSRCKNTGMAGEGF